MSNDTSTSLPPATRTNIPAVQAGDVPQSTAVLSSAKTRSERVADRSSIQTGAYAWVVALKKDNRGLFLVLMFAASIAACVVIGAWNPPFRFRLNTVTERAIICNTPFSVISEEGKRLAVEKARMAAQHVFINDPQSLISMREALWNTVAGLVNSHSYEQLDENGKKTWQEFLMQNGKGATVPDADAIAAFTRFVNSFENDTKLERFQNHLKRTFTPFEIHGILSKLPFGPEKGSQDQVLVYRKSDTSDTAVSYKVSEVLIRDGSVMKESLRNNLHDDELVDKLCNWLLPKLSDTLKEDPTATAAVEREAANAVKDVWSSFVTGQTIVDAKVSLKKNEIDLLEAEYRAALKDRGIGDKIIRFIALTFTLFLLFVTTWGFISRFERRRPHSFQSFVTLMIGIVLTIITAQYVQRFTLTCAEWEILPLVIFVMLISITYSWELATVLSILLSLIIVAGSGGGMGLFMMLLSVSVATAVQLGRLRNRRELIVVGGVSGLLVAALTIMLGILSGRPLGDILLVDALTNFCWALGAGVVVTATLPFIERPFGILTDMNLLELGDLAHPLLRQMIQVAPATYEHSMQVGTIAEKAAESIGARSLLTRVGASFHDIGKMMNPVYYSENQGTSENVHNHLEPHVSLLILIAHVKDGVKIANQYHLPRPIIDLIEQHHGTTITSFFYGNAKRSGLDVQESSFRYPGPKPQTKEAAILMIADTCESACRSMGYGVSPNKVDNMVSRLIRGKRDDGQFDESGLTLNELKTIEMSVISSIVASMHGRIKYPEPENKENKNDKGQDTVPRSAVLQTAQPLSESKVQPPAEQKNIQPPAQQTEQPTEPQTTQQEKVA